MLVRLMSFDKALSVARNNGFNRNTFNGEVCICGIGRLDIPWGKQIVIENDPKDEWYSVGEWKVPSCLFECEIHPSNEDEILRYGKIITDDSVLSDIGIFTRIRLISCDGDLWYHKMVNSKVVECKAIGKANA